MCEASINDNPQLITPSNQQVLKCKIKPKLKQEQDIRVDEQTCQDLVTHTR